MVLNATYPDLILVVGSKHRSNNCTSAPLNEVSNIADHNSYSTMKLDTGIPYNMFLYLDLIIQKWSGWLDGIKNICNRYPKTFCRCSIFLGNTIRHDHMCHYEPSISITFLKCTIILVKICNHYFFIQLFVNITQIHFIQEIKT